VRGGRGDCDSIINVTCGSDVWTVTGSTATAPTVPGCIVAGSTTLYPSSLTFSDGSLKITETIADEELDGGGQTSTTITGTCTQIDVTP